MNASDRESARPHVAARAAGDGVALPGTGIETSVLPGRGVDLMVTFGSRDRFAPILERVGLSPQEASRVADLVGGVTDLGSLTPGSVVEITLGAEIDGAAERPLDRLVMRPRFDLKVEVLRENGVLNVRTTSSGIDGLPMRIRGRAGTNLSTSVRAAGASADVADAYVRAIGGRTIEPDDRFDIIFEHRRASDGERVAGPLVYAGLNRPSGEDVALVRWTDGGRSSWVRPYGEVEGGGGLRLPLNGAVTSGFGPRRHPILGYTRMHRGVDLRARYGTPIQAVEAGTVLRAGWSGLGYGYQVRVAHSGGLVSTYSHMSRVGVSPGSTIAAGGTIGFVGSSGLSTGPHLHYELLDNGIAVDPLARSSRMPVRLTDAERNAVWTRMHDLQAIAVDAN